MKIGAENRTKAIAAGVLGAIALVLIVQFVWSSLGSSAPAAPPPQAAIKARPAVRGAKGLPQPRSLDPTLRYDWLKATEDTKYEGKGRNIFQLGTEPVETPLGTGATDHTAKVTPPVPTGPPPPPPITLKFFGFANQVGGQKRIFLSQGEDIFVASEGDIVDRRYKVLRITPQSVEIEDVLNNNRQSIPLTQG